MSGCGKLAVILRVLGFVLTLVAAILVRLNKQTKVVSLSLSPGLPLLDVVVVAKWHYLSAFVYLFVTNVIASLYGLLSLVVILTIKNRSNILVVLIVVLDTMMVVLLSSSGGAALAVGVIGYNGNSHVRWDKVCDTFGRFCVQVAVSSGLSLAGTIVFMLLVILAVVGLQKRPK